MKDRIKILSHFSGKIMEIYHLSIEYIKEKEVVSHLRVRIIEEIGSLGGKSCNIIFRI